MKLTLGTFLIAIVAAFAMVQFTVAGVDPAGDARMHQDRQAQGQDGTARGG